MPYGVLVQVAAGAPCNRMAGVVLPRQQAEEGAVCQLGGVAIAQADRGVAVLVLLVKRVAWRLVEGVVLPLAFKVFTP